MATLLGEKRARRLAEDDAQKLYNRIRQLQKVNSGVGNGYSSCIACQFLHQLQLMRNWRHIDRHLICTGTKSHMNHASDPSMAALQLACLSSLLLGLTSHLYKFKLNRKVPVCMQAWAQCRPLVMLNLHDVHRKRARPSSGSSRQRRRSPSCLQCVPRQRKGPRQNKHGLRSSSSS